MPTPRVRAPRRPTAGVPAGRVPPSGISWRLGRLLADSADPELPARHPHLLQAHEYLFRHAFGQVDETMVFPNIHTADVYAFDSRLVGDRADDITGLDAVVRPHFDAKSFHLGRGRFGALACRRLGLRRR